MEWWQHIPCQAPDGWSSSHGCSNFTSCCDEETCHALIHLSIFEQNNLLTVHCGINVLLLLFCGDMHRITPLYVVEALMLSDSQRYSVKMI